MSIAQDLLTRAKHRGYTPWQLVQKIGRLEREANDYTCQLVALATEVDELHAERDQMERQLDEAGIDLSSALDDLRIAKAETARALEALTATQARLANATAVSDLPQHVSTQPIPTVQRRFETGPVIRVGASPLAGTRPEHVPDAAVDDTQPIPVLAEAEPAT
ncbi:hypothetical protein ACWERY_02405 [Streptomyces sp. NPDC004082]